MSGLQVAIDSGGTFTDAVALAEDGSVRIAKVASTPADPAAATVAAFRAVVGDGTATELRHGTTVPTNTLLERRGARTALVATAGFGDVIEIGRQRRPDLYDVAADRPEPLVPPELRFEVDERTLHTGEVLTSMSDSALEELQKRIADAAPEAVAITLLHAYANAAHERRLAAALAAPGRTVVTSSSVAPEFREFERTSTTVLHAYLGPGTADYLSRLAADETVPERFLVMRSAGGLAAAAELSHRPADALLSGPAAGALAAAAVAAAAGYEGALGFDMGGTSTDVCLVESGRPELRALTVVGGLPCLAPALAVHTVGAGGGSIAQLDRGGALVVGPRSAGADPGPACYGRGGTEATVTDANVALGRVASLVGGRYRIVPERAGEALAALGRGAAHAVLEVVEATMERALREVSVMRGVDPAGCVIVAFGGAGGLHAAALCRALDAAAVLVPPHAGVLSAVGLLTAPVRADRSRTRIVPADDMEPAWLEPLVQSAAAEIRPLAQGRQITMHTSLDCRYRGQSHELRVDLRPGDTAETVVQRFHDVHERVNGYRRPGADVEVVTMRAGAEVAAGTEVSALLAASARASGQRSPVAERSADGILRLQRAALPLGFAAKGPALVSDLDATTWVPQDFTLAVDELANLVLEAR